MTHYFIQQSHDRTNNTEIIDYGYQKEESNLVLAFLILALWFSLVCYFCGIPYSIIKRVIELAEESLPEMEIPTGTRSLRYMKIVIIGLGIVATEEIIRRRIVDVPNEPSFDPEVPHYSIPFSLVIGYW